MTRRRCGDGPRRCHWLCCEPVGRCLAEPTAGKGVLGPRRSPLAVGDSSAATAAAAATPVAPGPSHTPCCSRPRCLQGLWGLKGVTFKLPEWMGGKK